MERILKEVTLEEIFDNTVVNPSTGCRDWIHSGEDRNSPSVMIDGRTWKVKRLVCTLVGGPISPGVQVRAKCNNLKCCNPDHLVAATRDAHRFSTEKRCRRCNTVKPTSEFHQGSGGPGYYQPNCKACSTIYSREIAQRLRREQPDRLRARQLRNYNLDNGKFLKLFQCQSGRCGICKEDLRLEDYAKPDGWVIDHSHDTGETRGFLCRACNLLLGAARDNEHTLLSAVEYLKNPPMGKETNF